MADSDRDSAQNSPKGNLPSRERERTWGQWKRKTFERWKEGLDDVFGGRPPRSAIWKEVSAIRDVLHRSVESTDTQSDTQGKFVHAYLVLPSSGDSQVHGAIRHSEPDCFLVNDSPRIQSGYVLKPKTLKFESPGGDLHHSYFWLNTASLKPSGVHSEDYYEGRNRERLCEVPGGQYVRIERWEEKMWTNDRGEREPIPEDSRPVTRYFREVPLLICCKSNPFKLSNPEDPDLKAENGFHAGVGEEDFRSFMSAFVDREEASSRR
ncbi:hypothetical protein GGQ05_001746 [Salinibacter ruber]|jgi:hypothetical protein|uniref:Uncharacterized protein n=1 Tax=Salinibacter ruber TaxID=146919 RepID=A0A9X2QCK6_9BACT|nr:hypothetical protein [Salinibacter ruber]MCS3709893.1 hypothetical protein [Salinibacter ruber]MCS4170280.1 hypothetical protein [Salinibacter ruber]